MVFVHVDVLHIDEVMRALIGGSLHHSKLFFFQQAQQWHRKDT